MKDILSPTEAAKSELSVHRRLIGGLLLILMNAMLFSYTNPFTSASFLVFVGYFLVSLDILVIVEYILRFLYVFIPSLRTVHLRLLIAVVSFCMILLALLSIGQLTPRDFLVVSIIWVVGYAYSLRIRPLFK